MACNFILVMAGEEQVACGQQRACHLDKHLSRRPNGHGQRLLPA
jgi:hypothetical protein